MNKIQGGKTALIIMGIVLLVLSIVSVIFGVILLINGLTGDPINILKIVFGILLGILFFPLLIVGIYFTWTGFALKATNGSIVEGNLGKGTMNKPLCDKCGAELNGEAFCPKCGQSTSGTKICAYCNAENKYGSKHCASCGKELD